MNYVIRQGNKIMVSIIIPVYNAEKYLDECVESVLSQTYNDYELILVDDGSTDYSGKICDRYAKADNRIVVIHQQNSGASAARNTGISEAHGEYITFVDSDDWIEPDYIERMVRHMVPYGYVAAYLVHDNDAPIQSNEIKYLTVEEALISVFSCKGIGGFSVAKMYDCRMIQEKNIRYSEDIGICEDELFNVVYISNTWSDIRILKYAGYHYRTSCDGATLGRYGHKPPRMKDFTEIVALERAESRLVNHEGVRKAWMQRRDKAAVATLRTMVSCDYDDKIEKKRLLKMIRRGCVRYIFGNVGCFSGKISMLLSAISPKLEWMVYKKQHSKKEMG